MIFTVEEADSSIGEKSNVLLPYLPTFPIDPALFERKLVRFRHRHSYLLGIRCTLENRILPPNVVKICLWSDCSAQTYYCMTDAHSIR